MSLGKIVIITIAGKIDEINNSFCDKRKDADASFFMHNVFCYNTVNHNAQLKLFCMFGIVQ